MFQNHRVLGVIPARYGSTRFPGKMLVNLNGKPLVQHVFEGCSQSIYLDDLIIACDDERILRTAGKFGAKALMTSAHHESGTDRVAEVASQVVCDWVVNIQGDEPLMKGHMVDEVIRGLGSGADMSTLAKPMYEEESMSNPNVVKVVCDELGYALYFSRSAIPFRRSDGPWCALDPAGKPAVRWLKHLGIYAFRKEFLLKVTRMKPSRLENLERLEQLRVLESGSRMMVRSVEDDSIGVDTPRDLEEVKKIL